MKMHFSHSLTHASRIRRADLSRRNPMKAEVRRRRITHASRRSQTKADHDRSGSAVIVVLALLALIFLYLAGNLGTLHHLGRELKLLDQKQTLRLEPASTNLLQKPKP
jgi:hypothetical protein